MRVPAAFKRFWHWRALMSPFVYIALFGWIPFTFLLFTYLPPRRAVLVSLLGGWLFLPITGFALPGLPDFTKLTAISLGTLLAALAFDGKTMFSYRLRALDFPVWLWCLWPIASSVLAGLGFQAGLSAALDQSIRWGIPYLLGRVYFRDRADLLELIRVVAVAGMVYVPFCLWEVRMSPNLHHTVYGFSQHQFMQAVRTGGYRPQVFLEHGLSVGLFMTTASLCAAGLWLQRIRQPMFSLSLGLCTLLLIGTTLLCRSTGAIALLVVGLGVLYVMRRRRRLWPVYLLLLLAPLMMVGRTAGMLETETLVGIATSVFDPDRVNSLTQRLETEDVLLQRANERPLSGWGPWGAYRVGDEGGGLVKATDGFWVIVLGKYGYVGLISFVLLVLLGSLRALRTTRRAIPYGGFSVAVPILSVLLGVYLADALLNAFSSPHYALIAGGLASFGLARVTPRARGS